MVAELLRLVPTIFLLLLLAALAFVLWRGEAAERAAIGTIAIGSVLSALAARPTGLWKAPETGILVVDAVVLIAFATILKSSNRFWPLWITAFQIIAVVTHLARLARPNTLPLAYAVAEQLWAYPMLVILVIVIWRRKGVMPTR